MKNSLFLFLFLPCVSFGGSMRISPGGIGNINVSRQQAVDAVSASQTLTGVCIDSTTTGTLAWVNPSDAQVDDELLYATVTNPVAFPTITHYLFCTSPGFSIPSNAIIDGINIRWDISTVGAGGTTDIDVRLLKGNVVGATNKAGATWTGTDTPTNYGGSTDLWGDTWTPADINALDFGWVDSVAVGGTGQVGRIDYQEATIYYHTPGVSSGNIQIR